ncbi:MAG: FAD-linked oxidase C-terminal domain-containing protein [Desulfovermiculus sp.]|nr:FAD-linked oxidase C-terminal domain-containing protein [Desulfovermiculus sp.]
MDKISENTRSELAHVVGRENCRDTIEDRISFSFDAHTDESLPDVVLFPQTGEQIAEIMCIAHREVIPVTARGAGTSICGAPIPVCQGVVLVLTKMNKILEVNTKDRYAIVQPGVVNADLQKVLSEEGFFFPPDPASLSVSTLGGNVAQNAGGPRGLKYGVTRDYLLGLESVLADGRIIRCGSRNVKDVTGYDVTRLFCGAEGTLGIVTEITLRVVPLPEAQRTVLAVYNDLDNTAQTVSDIIGSGILPAGMELMDRVVVNAVEDSAGIGLPREAEGLLLIDVDGMEEAVDREMERIVAKAKANGAVEVKHARTPADREELWTARRSAYGVFARMAPNCIVEDATVPVSNVPAMIRGMREIFDRYELRVGILAHAGDGNMHPLISTDIRDKEEWARVEQAIREVFELAVSLQGTLSGEHGIGTAKTAFLPLFQDEPTRSVMMQIKKALDPLGILNPGKFV